MVFSPNQIQRDKHAGPPSKEPQGLETVERVSLCVAVHVVAFHEVNGQPLIEIFSKAGFYIAGGGGGGGEKKTFPPLHSLGMRLAGAT